MPAFLATSPGIELDASRGLIPGVKTVNKFGKAPDGVDAGVETDIWTRADISNTQPVWLAPTAARIHSIVSSNAADAAAGTGAVSVTIHGLTSWSTAEVSETVTLTGVTPVNTVNSYVIIHRMSANSQASTTNVGTNTGTITATAATDNSITAVIPAGKGQTQMAIYGIPSIQSFYVINYQVAFVDTISLTNVAVNVGLLLNLNPTVNTKAFKVAHQFGLTGNGSSNSDYDFKVPLKIAGPAIIKLSCSSVGGNDIGVSACFDGYLVTN